MCFGQSRDETFEQGDLCHYGLWQAFGPLLLVRRLGTPRTILSSVLAWLLVGMVGVAGMAATVRSSMSGSGLSSPARP